MTEILITRAGPLCTLQDAGRFGLLRHGIGASGPMDGAAFERAAAWMGSAAPAGIEFTTAGLAFRVEGGLVGIGLDGGAFTLRRNGQTVGWPARLTLGAGDEVEITPGPAGNYGYVRFDRIFDLPPVLGSWATNSVVGLGGYEGRSLREGDRLVLGGEVERRGQGLHPRAAPVAEGPMRILWGLHADRFDASVRQRFAQARFAVSALIDRMGARLVDTEGTFGGAASLSLVSDAIVPGDIQVLGDGTPIVLMRDHQPTGGYPRIATVISADLDRFAQLRPSSEVRFEPVAIERAHAEIKGESR